MFSRLWLHTVGGATPDSAEALGPLYAEFYTGIFANIATKLSDVVRWGDTAHRGAHRLRINPNRALPSIHGNT